MSLETKTSAARELGGGLVVVKAQVKTGGRGKAGGVKLARSPQEAADRAEEILGMDIKGHEVRRVLVASGADIAREFYFSTLLDRSERRCLAMCSVEGGMDIETLAKERPEALAKVAVDPNVIPLGSRLYIPGYGEAIAADTGGAIVGNTIDLCMESYDEAIQFGRRSVEVYVID